MGIITTVEEIAKITSGSVIGDKTAVITGMSAVEDAREGDLTFVANQRYLKYLPLTKASAIIVSEGVSAEGKNLIVVKDAYIAFSKVLKNLAPKLEPLKGIHPKAEIHPKATVGGECSIGAYAVIDEDVKIGCRAVIYPGVYIGRDTVIGDDTIIYSNVSIRERVNLGNRVIIHCNSVIGSDGFGYAKEGNRCTKIPQIGTVVIEDDVEIGACVTIDRATVSETRIKRGTKIDNLVQIAHNVVIGEDSIIIAQVGISGSTKIGSRVTIAGQVGITGHIEITDDTIIGAKSGVSNDIKTPGAYTGYPAMPHTDWLKAQAVFGKLPGMKKRLMELEKRIKEIEKIVSE